MEILKVHHLLNLFSSHLIFKNIEIISIFLKIESFLHQEFFSLSVIYRFLSVQHNYIHSYNQ